MTGNTPTAPVNASYEDLQTVAEIVTTRLSPGSGEADRAAHVRKLLDVTADLNHAISKYTHRVHALADAYRHMVAAPCPSDHAGAPESPR